MNTYIFYFQNKFLSSVLYYLLTDVLLKHCSVDMATVLIMYNSIGRVVWCDTRCKVISTLLQKLKFMTFVQCKHLNV